MMNMLVKPLTGILGLALTIMGVVGFFVPNGMLLVFEMDTVQSVIHLFSGLIALFCFNSSQVHSRWYLIVFGLAYGIIAVAGFLMGGDVLGLFHANTAENYLYLAIGAASLIVGFGSGR